MEAIYFDSFKMIPSTTTFEGMLNLSSVIILPNLKMVKNRVVNRMFPGPERDLPGRPWDKEPGIDEPYLPDDPGEIPSDPWDDEEREGAAE
ncbi:hypothetical protein [Cuniculiplasma divulgatum]|uniref:Uncharacterized protein n=1 Tax=Cuniculiplasma divulgatum TaxID=1673428 RepID=A0A1R4A7S1_9ARCH|nr:hypothetical protein [Cuniculiplasma divulgatum]WMT48492.1 MAG: hypothetical protein RE472_05290 [Thermoplasmatales archaeon]SJK85025.1 hypothetical protein CPM_1218 [Cuniculiplasma divulgatum]